jgi:integrase
LLRHLRVHDLEGFSETSPCGNRTGWNSRARTHSNSAEAGKLNFQILRRTFATLAYVERKGTPKDLQTLLRHTRPDTTLLNYVKEIPDSVFGMVDAMYEGINRSDEKQLLAASPTLGVQ